MADNYSNKEALSTLNTRLDFLKEELKKMDKDRASGINLTYAFINKYNQYMNEKNNLESLVARIGSMHDSYVKPKGDEKIEKINQEIAQKRATLNSLTDSDYAKKQKEKLEEEIADLNIKKERLEAGQSVNTTNKLDKEKKELASHSKNKINEDNANVYTAEMRRQQNNKEIEAANLASEGKYVKSALKKGSAFISYSKGEMMTMYCAMLTTKNNIFSGTRKVASAPFKKVKELLKKAKDSIGDSLGHRR